MISGYYSILNRTYIMLYQSLFYLPDHGKYLFNTNEYSVIVGNIKRVNGLDLEYYTYLIYETKYDMIVINSDTTHRSSGDHFKMFSPYFYIPYAYYIMEYNMIIQKIVFDLLLQDFIKARRTQHLGPDWLLAWSHPGWQTGLLWLG